MPPKLQSIKTLQDQVVPPRISHKEQEMAKYFAAFQKLVVWLQSNWDGQTIVVPMPPSLSNGYLARAHWSEISAVKNQYYGFMRALQALRLLPPAPAEPPRIARISMHLYVWTMMDKSGAIAKEKMPVDWLVRNCYLADDSEKHLVWAGMPEQTLTRREPPRIEFRIEPVE